MKIAIVTFGSRGDVQPYIAVARALMSRGHEVWLAATEEQRPLIERYGVAHRVIGPNFRAMTESDLGRAWLSSGDSPLKYARYAKELFLPMQRRFCEEADAVVEGADAVAFYALATGALHAAQRRKLPCVALSPWPLVPTAEVSPAPALQALPGFVRKATGHLFLRMAFSSFNGEHLAYRAGVGLPPYRSRDIVHFVLEAGVPSVHLFSETILPRPRDWDARHAVAGFAFVPPAPYEPPAGLEDFLSSGSKPIYMGFGSMTGLEAEQLAALCVDAARLAGVRAVIAGGWARLAPPASDDLFVVDEIPHDYLFPRVAAVVHHGGVGTFAEGLRAGKPTVIAAFFGDQPLWGHLNHLHGAGPRALRRSRISAKSLAAAIRQATLNDAFRARAEEIASRLSVENGAARAAQLVERAFAAS